VGATAGTAAAYLPTRLLSEGKLTVPDMVALATLGVGVGLDEDDDPPHPHTIKSGKHAATHNPLKLFFLIIKPSLVF
jgi:hypothetical protein